MKETNTLIVGASIFGLASSACLKTVGIEYTIIEKYGQVATPCAPLINVLTGHIKKLGLRRLPYGPLEQIKRDQTVPLLDAGTLKLIRDGHCHIHPGIDHVQDKTIYFTSGSSAEFDSIVSAIGYDKGFEKNILHVDPKRFGDLNVRMNSQKYFRKDGL